MNKDKFIAEKLGLCWHTLNQFSNDNSVTCIYCRKSFENIYFYDPLQGNPDFTSESGKVKLLKLIETKPWLLWNIVCSDYPSDRYAPIDIFNTLISWMKNDTGLFRDTVFRWLGGVE